MKTVISVASALACAFSLDAQMTTTLNRLPDGVATVNGLRTTSRAWEVRVRNTSGSSLVAFAVAAKATRSVEKTAPMNVDPAYVDAAIDTTATPVLPNGERVITVGGVFLEEPIVTAGIFADGVTTGDAILLTRLILRRTNMLLALEMALEALSDAARQSIPRYQLTVQFKKMADSLRRWYLPQEQQIGLRVYQPILRKLMDMEKGQGGGSPDPLATFIAEETAILRQQRVSLSESQPSLVDAAYIGR
jgi:hypothetical protein